jgi:AraC-like DNA-binding protein
MHQVRAVSLSNYVGVANAVGLDGKAMLRLVGLTPEMLRDPERRVPAGAATRLLELSAEQSGREDFGLLMASCRTFASLGPVAMLLERLPDTREIVRTAIARQRHFNDVVEISLEETGDSCVVKFTLAPGYNSPHVTDAMLGMAERTLSGATSGAWYPEAVHLMRRPPRDPGPWRRFFRCPVEFTSSFNGFSSSSGIMSRRNPKADAVMAANARRLLDLLPVAEGPSDVPERVRRSIAQLLPRGQVGLGRVAADMGMSARSLQRHLAQDGSTFAALLEEVRHELASGYLAHSAHPITAVAGLVGYASPSAFTRWFASSFGMSPQEWRARANAAP